MELSNKIVLVTGGTSGIGLEAAKLFREEGATATKAAVRWSLMAAYRSFDFLGAKRRRLRKMAAAFPFQPSAALSVLSQNRRF